MRGSRRLPEYHCTLEEVAEELYRSGITDRRLSREMIRQIEDKALEKVADRLKGYEDWDG